MPLQQKTYWSITCYTKPSDKATVQKPTPIPMYVKNITPKRPKAVQIWMHKTSPRGVTRSNYAEPRGGVLGAKYARLS